MQKTTLSILFLCFISAFGLPVFAEDGTTIDKLPEPFLIVPQPQKVELLRGDGLEFGKLENLILIGEFKRPVMGCILSQLTESNENGKGTLTLKLDSHQTVQKSAEGYVLTISDGDVVIISGGSRFVLWLPDFRATSGRCA